MDYGRRKIKEDRLSKLPNHILVDILSLLPLHSAIATSVLSRQWRDLWTHIHSLDVQVSEFKVKGKGKGKGKRWINNLAMFSTVENIIRKLKSPYFVRFHLSLGRHHVVDLTDETKHVLGSLFREICGRRIQQIHLTHVSDDKIDNYYGYRRVILFSPPCIFETNSLVSLEIGINFWLLSRNMNLPNLKKLRISRYEYRVKTLEKLIRSCPLLEEFFLDLDVSFQFIAFNTMYNLVLNISATNLKRLDLCFPDCWFHAEIRIHAPNLQYLTITTSSIIDKDYLTFKFVENPIAFIGARIYKSSHDFFIHQTSKLSNFLDIISHVRSLELDHVRFIPSPTFFNLTRLKLEWPLPSRVLVKFLKHCPALEVLQLDIVVDDAHSKDLEWISSLRSRRSRYVPPTCLRTCLKVVEIKTGRLENRECWMLFIKYMLQNSQVLEKFTFKIEDKDRQTEDEFYERKKERKFFKRLLALPRSSSKCQLEILGKYHKKEFFMEILLHYFIIVKGF